MMEILKAFMAKPKYWLDYPTYIIFGRNSLQLEIKVKKLGPVSDYAIGGLIAGVS
jgi:hypothetical protein